MPTVFVPTEIIENKILLIRGKKVMMDYDFAQMYGVTTSYLNRQVRRNIARFPEDFMVHLTRSEFDNLKCHFGMSSWGGKRALPLAFTEQGMAMLSGVLHSPREVQVNIAIMSAFVKLRELMMTHKDLARKIEDLEKEFNQHDDNFVAVFAAIRKLLQGPASPRKKKSPIGFQAK